MNMQMKSKIKSTCDRDGEITMTISVYENL